MDVFLLFSQHSLPEKYDENVYFTEDKTYWTPSENTSVLYEQLAQNKYREILRQQIQLAQLMFVLNLYIYYLSVFDMKSKFHSYTFVIIFLVTFERTPCTFSEALVFVYFLV